MRLKVLRVTNSLDFGGIEKVFELHARYLDKATYELVFVGISYGGHISEILKNLGYRIIILEKKARIPSLSAFRALYLLFKAEKPKVVHTCGAEANFHGLIAAYFAGVTLRIGEEIGIPNHSRVTKIVFRFTYFFANTVIAISGAVRDYLIKYEVNKRKVKLIYNPVAISNTLEKTLIKTNERLIIATLCRLEPIKNIQALVQLISDLLVSNPTLKMELWIIGEGSQRTLLEEMVRIMNLESKIRFLGFQGDPSVFLVQAHLFMLPSWNEGFGLACIEAIQCGLIPIVSNRGGMKEFIKDEYNGFLFNPADRAEILNKTIKAIELDENNRNVFRKRGKAVVDEMFSPSNYLKSLERLYLKTEE